MRQHGGVIAKFEQVATGVLPSSSITLDYGALT